ncbi:SufE family protein [Acetobacter vaccinii]|uniref:SufE family protein n=1 Tax=Acetobacter vaccinii TaxID=2592655 RepID=A0A5C1YNC2_9PROT|nr:SufE family protein [Acetobacter vaccinii]QEO16332.1 SufE family protein [Acetobacter vaccinii]
MDAAFVIPREETAALAIEAIADELDIFDDWMERYQYIIEMGRKLPPFPTQWCDDAHRVPGCQSQVWLQEHQEGDRLYFAGSSDAAIVCGLVALLLRVYSGRTRAEIEATEPTFLSDLGLVQALSTNRGNGVQAMAHAIRSAAAVMVG